MQKSTKTSFHESANEKSLIFHLGLSDFIIFVELKVSVGKYTTMRA